MGVITHVKRSNKISKFFRPEASRTSRFLNRFFLSQISPSFLDHRQKIIKHFKIENVDAGIYEEQIKFDEILRIEFKSRLHFLFEFLFPFYLYISLPLRCEQTQT